MRVGSRASRALAAASRDTLYTASTSLPSTRTPGNPYASAFFQMGAAVCFWTGTEMAQWLFWQKNTTGHRSTAATLHPSWKSPWDVAPSPKYTMAQASLPSSRAPRAHPTAWRTWLETGTEISANRDPRGPESAHSISHRSGLPAPTAGSVDRATPPSRRG